MKRWIAALTASALLVAAGLVHGLWTDRWHQPADVRAAAEAMDRLALDVGPWKGTSLTPGSAGAGVAGCIQRRYEPRAGGTGVSMALVCGRPGPVAIHTPEACYGASGFRVGPRQRIELPGLGVFWRTDATRKTATDELRLRIYFGWQASGGWTAPEDARTTFAGERLLHKLYVVRELHGSDDKTEPCEDFLRVLLPELQKSVLGSNELAKR